MSQLAKLRSRLHPGSYLWIMPAIVLLGYELMSIKYINFSNLFITFLRIAIVQYSNWLIWIHNRSTKRTFFYSSVIAVISTTLVYRQLIAVFLVYAGIALIYLLIQKLKRLRNLMGYIIENLRGLARIETSRELSLYFLLSGLALELTGIYQNYRENLGTSLMFLVIFLAIK
jgi:hypothetical protein